MIYRQNKSLSWLGALLLILSLAIPLTASRVVEGEPAPAADDAVDAPANAEAEDATGPTADDAETTDDPAADATTETPAKKDAPKVKAKVGEKIDVYIVPIEGPIMETQLFILRRALKEAIKNDVETVLLDMDTPGGALGVTIEMMEALDYFEGDTITFVNDEAISAGSYISISTDDIWFAPKGLMGAAEAVAGTGADIPESMQRKIDSYLRAKVRAISGEYRYRGDVQRAMMDPEFELIIDGEILKRKGELLSLTADEAAKEYGMPPEPLLAAGIAEDVTDLLNQKYGEGNYVVKTFEITWSESFAKWFEGIAPILMGLGILFIYFEAQSPGFGVFGGLGICLMLLVFGSSYYAGLAGNEAIIFFVLGLILICVEIFLLPGTLIAGFLGALLVIGSLVWALADIWPEGAKGFELTPDTFFGPLGQVTLGLLIAFGVGLATLRYMPESPLKRMLVLGAEVGDPSPETAAGGRSIDYPAGSGAMLPEPGARGQAVTDLHPGGQVEVDGKRFQARVMIGSIESGQSIEVVELRDFSIVVKAV